MKWLIVISMFFFSPLMSICQTDSDTLLTFDDYISLINQHHPMVYQANLLRDMADANQMIARGYFDPKIGVSFDRKSFDNKDYYNILNGALSVPLWFGADIKVGYERSSGEFINPEAALPNQGLLSAGISIPLGSGLFFDERRQMVRQAEVYAEANDLERVLMFNDLYFDAVLVYTDWQQSYNNYEIAAEGVALASERFEGAVRRFENGDIPAIDTLEAFIQLQTRSRELIEQSQIVNEARTTVNNYLWFDGRIPLEVKPDVRPEELFMDRLANRVDSLSILMDQVIDAHPELMLYNNKIRGLEIDQRMNRENLKPDLRLDFHPLLSSNEALIPGTFSANDYKFGVNLAYPLYLRKERGKIKLTEQKIRDAEYDRSLKRQDLTNKLLIYRANEDFYIDQLAILDDNVNNYKRLRDAELRKFQIGESSIFLVNSREVKYLEIKMKRVELINKLIQNRASYIYLSGMQSLQ